MNTQIENPADAELTQKFKEMGLERIEVLLKDNIAEVYMDNPPHNNVSIQVLRELGEIFDTCLELQKTSTYELKGVIISSKNRRAFSSGASLDMLNDLGGEDNENRKQFLEISKKFRNTLKEYPIPSIAAINGICLGAGLEIALHCHYRVCGSGVYLGFPEITLGFIPGAGGTQVLPRLIGRSKAVYMLLSGKFFSAEEAFQMGVVDRVVPRKSVMNVARMVAGELCCHHHKATQYLLQAVDEGLEMELDDGLQLESRLFWELVDDRIKASGGISDNDLGMNVLKARKQA